MERWVGKVAVVTGASSGVGYATADLLVKKGMTVVGFARRIEKIEELKKSLQNASGKLHALKTDISKEDEVQKSFDWIKKNLGSVHVLVNNAGVYFAGKLVETDITKVQELFDVNVVGLCACTKAAFQLMKETGVDDGHIININAVVGHQVLDFGEPVFNAYPATKFAVTALTETLRQELRFLKTKIRVTSLSPGYITSYNPSEEDQAVLSEEKKEFYRIIPGLRPEDVADTIVYALSTPPHVQIHELIFTAIEKC